MGSPHGKVTAVLSVGHDPRGHTIARVRYEDGVEADRLCDVTVEGRIMRADGREELAEITNVKAGGTA